MTTIHLIAISSIENINHRDDWYIYHPGGYIVFCEKQCSPLRFWYQGQCVELKTTEDVKYLREVYASKSFCWVDPPLRNAAITDVYRHRPDFVRNFEQKTGLFCSFKRNEKTVQYWTVWSPKAVELFTISGDEQMGLRIVEMPTTDHFDTV